MGHELWVACPSLSQPQPGARLPSHPRGGHSRDGRPALMCSEGCCTQAYVMTITWRQVHSHSSSPRPVSPPGGHQAQWVAIASWRVGRTLDSLLPLFLPWLTHCKLQSTKVGFQILLSYY